MDRSTYVLACKMLETMIDDLDAYFPLEKNTLLCDADVRMNLISAFYETIMAHISKPESFASR
jgi:hypothetical protein